MHAALRLFGGIALAALSATALDKQFVQQLRESAGNIERDATAVSTALKSKKSDASHITQTIDAMSGDLGKLAQLVTEFESANPQLSGRDAADWKLVREKVQLLEIFHREKKKLATEDLSKNRRMIRAHAEGVARRAAKLQQFAETLQRVPLS